MLLKKKMVTVLMVCWLSACNIYSARADDAIDPLETINRSILSFNNVMLTYAAEPVVYTYRLVAPPWSRRMIAQFYGNIGELPLVLSSALQNDFSSSGSHIARFIINTTLGFFGAVDVADAMGIEAPHNSDFNHLLSFYGVDQGYYIMVPLFGPRTTRTIVGDLINHTVGPIAMVDYVDYSSLADSLSVLHNIQAVSMALDNLSIFEDNTDPYLLIRSAYLQSIRTKKDNEHEEDFLDSFE